MGALEVVIISTMASSFLNIRDEFILGSHVQNCWPDC
jgi:hypothetical protein